jgi:phenylacetate-coenzyme A ligase PaaK-like adenylate-forming protein
MKPRSGYDRLSQTALEYALAHIPGYAAWRTLDPGPSVPIDERYARLPTLTKQALRQHFPDGFIPPGRNLQTGLKNGEVEYAVTSGSTDDQVTLVFHAPWWEASEKAAWQLNAQARQIATGTHREVVLASPRCVGPGYSDRVLSMAERTIGRHLYPNQKINPTTWSDADIRRMAEELNRYQPVVLEADAAYLAVFARRLAALNLSIVQPRLIFLTYSFPSRVYLRQIRQVFTAPVVSSYGSTETGHVFMECEAGRLHQNTAHCRVDFRPWLPRYGGPQLGGMLVTVFHNPWFAVLRFDIGDVARLDHRGPCPCGRTEGLTLASIDGRTKDVTFAPDGRAITVNELDRALAGVPTLAGWQLDLPEPARLHLRILADPGTETQTRRAALELMEGIYGPDMQIEVTVVPSLQHEPSGKFRFARAAFSVNHERLWGESPPLDV